MDPQRRTILASAAAGASVASLLFSGYLLWSRNGGRGSADKASSPATEKPSDPATFPSSTGDVSTWLSRTSASPEVARIFAFHQVDGEALAALAMQDLIRMGVSPKDRSAVMAALAAAEGLPAASAAVPVHARSAGSLQPSRRGPPPRVAGDEPRAAVPFHTFLSNAEDMFTALVNPSPPPRGGDEMDPQRERLLMASRLYDLFDSFHDLTTAEQSDAMLPLARRLNVVLTRPTPRPGVPRPAVGGPGASAPHTAVAPKPDEEAPAVGLGLQEKMRPLHDMVDGFIQLLQASDLDGVPAEELEPLAVRISEQIGRVTDVARRLPPPLAQPLQAKCGVVTQLLAERLSTPASPPTRPAHTAAAGDVPVSADTPGKATAQWKGGPPAAPSAAALIGRLRSVFLRTRDSALLEMEAEERLRVVSAMIEEVKSIQGALSAMPPSEPVQTGKDVSENVLALLEQLRALTVDEAKLARDEAADAQANEDGRDLPDGATNAEDVGGLGAEFTTVTAAFLKRIREVLQSPQYTAAPPEVRKDVVQHLRERVDALGTELEKLPSAQRGPAARVIAQAKHLLEQASGGSAEDEQEPGQEPKEEKPEDDDDDADNEGDDDAEAAGVQVVPVAEDLDDAVTQIESIFKLLNSDRFEAAPIAEKQLMATELLKRVRALKGPILQALRNEKSHPIFTELVDPLEDLLESMSQMTGPSEQFREVLQILEDMGDALSSNDLSQASRERREGSARAIIHQLQRVTGTFAGLKPSERAVAEKLVATLNEKLVAFVHGIKAQGKAGHPTASVDEDDDAAEETGCVSPREILAALQAITGGLRGPAFAEASASGRAAMIDSSTTKLRGLLASCGKLSPAEREQLEPFIEKTLTSFQALRESMRASAAPQESARTPPAAEEATPPLPHAERRSMFDSLRGITSELRQGNRRGIRLSEAESRPLRQLLAMVNEVGDFTDEERQLYEDFTSELLKAEEATEPQPVRTTTTTTAAAALDNEDEADSGHPPEEGSDDGVDSFVQVFSSILKAFDRKEPSSFSALTPIVSVVEGTLSAADERGVPWQTNPEAVRMVSAVFSKIKAAKDKLSAGGRDVAEGVAALAQAKAQLAARPPRTQEELTPYLDLLRSQVNMPGLTLAKASAMEELKDAILAARERLQNAETGSSKASVAEEAAEGKAPEPTQTQESRVADALLDLSDKLRDTNLSDDVLDEYEGIVNGLADAVAGIDDFAEPVESVREQIKLQRIGNAPVSADADADQSTEASHQADSHDKDDRDSSTAPDDALEKGSADACSVPVDAPEELPDIQELSRDGVIGGPENEVTLLAKVEQRVALPTEEFTAANSLFDIQNISKVLLHLSTTNPIVRRTPALKKRVEEAKAKFISQLAAFHVAENASQASLSSVLLRVTGTNEPQEEHGEGTHNLLVFTAAEAEQYPVNEAMMSFLQEPKNVVDPTIEPNVAESWEGASTAFLVYISGETAEGPSGSSTALSELVLLHEVLVKRYGFDVVAVTDPKLSAEAFVRMLRTAAASSRGRMLVFFCTPPSQDVVAVPHAATFRDNSVLEYARILEETNPDVERVVVAHSLPRKLEMACRFKDKKSSTMSMQLTSKAAKEVAKLRCWLYDGLFTPIVVELLSRDEGRMLCPEDLINYAVTATTRTTLLFGSFTDGEPASMAFFLPVDR